MKKRHLLAGSILAATIFFIFNLSTQDATASNGLSKEVTYRLSIFIEKLPFDINPALLSNSLVRDLAHITLFFLFGVLCMGCFYLLSSSSLGTVNYFIVMMLV